MGDLARATLPESMLGSLRADGIIDPVAIGLAASGARRVALTSEEQLLAAACILAGGGRQVDVAARLGITPSKASRIRGRLARLYGPR